jgi:U32 family peptidase
MAPAGDWDCARAAVENGADAVYFGLQGGLNARARAANFSAADLPELMTFLRTRGVRGYLTLNTLVFRDELEEAEQVARQAVAAGVDAVLVQDIGLLRLIHRLCPELPLHASTQMTLSSAECIREVECLGVRRVVLPRELSIAQIAAIRQQTHLELEAFVHGALCISYSGQCLASLSMGGRSSNRGQCAQPCRLPYEVLCDGRSMLPSPVGRGAGGEGRAGEGGVETRQTATLHSPCNALTLTLSQRERGPAKRYPLSPHDLAAYDRLPELMAAGVSALKIEGRLKPAEYVASVTSHYRAAIDAIGGTGGQPAPQDVAEMEMAFSRGFCHGWLDGNNPHALVSGQSSAKRGTLLGQVKGVRGERVLVELAGPIRRGDGVVFEGDRSKAAEQGGRVYEVFQGKRSIEDEVSGGLVELAFRYGAIRPSEIRRGQKVWKTDDPQAARRLRKTYSSGHAQRCVHVDLTIEAAVGRPLLVIAAAATGAACRLESAEPLSEAQKHPLTAEVLREQFGRLGKTPYQLRRLDARIDGRPMVPLSVLGTLRHEMVRQLDAAMARPPRRAMAGESVLAGLRANRLATDSTSAQTAGRLAADGTSAQMDAGRGFSLADVPSAAKHHSALCHLHVLCRSMEQIEAALACGISSVIVDLVDLNACPEAVRLARAGGAEVLVATPRIHKPDESDAFELVATCRPDGVLVRNLAGLAFFRRVGLPTVADFSLNAANDLTVEWLCGQGAQRVTAAYDLNRRRLLDLAAAMRPERLEVVVHRHTPMFHSEYCVFCGMLSQGTNSRDCGRPCERHELRLRDRLGVEHLLLADSQCRNTLFHAEADRLLAVMQSLLERGVRHFRVELLAETTTEEVQLVTEPFRRLLSPTTT